MDEKLCRSVNTMSLEQFAHYFSIDSKDVIEVYDELLGDTKFLGELNEMIASARKVFTKGIFTHENLNSADWFGLQRILLYTIIRIFKPEYCLETGVFYGGTTAFILNALRKNNKGKLISIDYGAVRDSNDPDFFIPEPLDIGFIVHENLKSRWELVKGDSLKEIEKINAKIDFYNHDSDHSYSFVKNEMSLVYKKLAKDAVIMADDIDHSNGFFSFCDEKKLYPLLLTDNGKDNLRMRTGIAFMNHPNNLIKGITS